MYGAPAGSDDERIERIECTVWVAGLGLAHPAHVDMLNPAERERHAAYRMAADRDRFAIGAALLRLVAAAELGVGAAAVPVDRACRRCQAQHGKPRIPETGLHVSISHSGDKVVLALTRVAPIGVDVEEMARRDTAGLARSVLAPGEQITGPADFYTYWCRKEAVVKATGDGLRVPFVNVVVSPPGAPARLVSYQDKPIACTISDLATTAGYAGAIAVLADGELLVRMHDAADLLRAAAGQTRAGGRAASE